MKSKSRCGWCGTDSLYVSYHDKEWGVPVFDDQKIFEFLVLESAQAGLSWITVLRKRENYRRLFAGFDPQKVARFSDVKIEKLLLDPGIIRNRAKVLAAVNNAKIFLDLQEKHNGFHKFIWSFVDGKPVQNKWASLKQIPPTTEISDKMSKEMKSLGFKFLGSTVLYAHMQATGMVNDHVKDCFRWKQV